MTTDRRITLFHAPNSRSTGVVMLLEELHAEYQLHLLDMKNNEQRGAADMLWGTALNWMLSFKLVPTLPVITSYAERIAARPSVTRVTAQEAERVAT